MLTFAIYIIDDFMPFGFENKLMLSSYAPPFERTVDFVDSVLAVMLDFCGFCLRRPEPEIQVPESLTA